MSSDDIAAILRAHIYVKPHDDLLPAIEQHIQGHVNGDKHFCTITGIDKAAAAIVEKLKQ